MKEKAVTDGEIMKDAGAVANLKGVCDDSIWKKRETKGGAIEEQGEKIGN